MTYVPEALCEKESSIFAHYESGINFDKYDDILVDVSGSNPPTAIMVSALLVALFLKCYFINLLTLTTEWASPNIGCIVRKDKEKIKMLPWPQSCTCTINYGLSNK